jgi:hypothetical protein
MTSEPSQKAAALFPRPAESEIVVARERVAGATCERCGSSRIERYPVLRVGGWKLLTRCQDCLGVVQSEDAPTPFGFTYLPYGSYLRRRRVRSDD